MKINWLALMFWLLVAAAGVATVAHFTRHRAAPVEVVTPTAQTMPVQPPVAAVPAPSPIVAKPRYRPVTKRVVHRKPIPRNYVADCSMVPAVARTMPWSQLAVAARQRGLTAAQIAQLRACVGD